MDFPGGPVVKNPPANAGDDMGSTSALGSFHMLGASIEPVRLEPVLCNKRSHCEEKPAPHNND